MTRDLLWHNTNTLATRCLIETETKWSPICWRHLMCIFCFVRELVKFNVWAKHRFALLALCQGNTPTSISWWTICNSFASHTSFTWSYSSAVHPDKKLFSERLHWYLLSNTLLPLTYYVLIHVSSVEKSVVLESIGRTCIHHRRPYHLHNLSFPRMISLGIVMTHLVNTLLALATMKYDLWFVQWALVYFSTTPSKVCSSQFVTTTRNVLYLSFFM